MVRKLKLAAVALLSALLIPLAVAPLTAVAADTDSGLGSVSKSKEATNLDGNFVSNVTLSLPAADYKGDLDVVFVLDGSTSTDKSDLAGEAAGTAEGIGRVPEPERQGRRRCLWWKRARPLYQ